MGVGDYIHSKEIGQQRAFLHEAPVQPPRQFQFPAGMAAVEPPPMKLMAPVPVGPGMAGLPYAQEEGAEQEDMFDTDVEGIDESTIGANSVADTEEYQPQPSRTPRPQQLPHLPTIPQEPTVLPQNEDTNARLPYQFRHGRRSHQPNWYESLGEKAMRPAGFEPEDVDDDGSQLTSVAGDDESNDWYYSHKHRAGPEEPLSKRMDSFWNAGRRMPPRSMSQLNLDHNRVPALTPSHSDPKRMEHVMSTGGNRKVTLSRSMTTTPRTRFSPPKPSLLEQLDNSPTRQAGSRSRPRRSSVIDLRQRNHDNENDTNQFTVDNNDRQDSIDGQSMTAFDITNVVALDEDDSLHDPFFRPDRNGTSLNSSPSPKKRQLEADYPPSILYQKSFTELQAEPFERSPPATTSTNTNTISAQYPSFHDHDSGPEDKYSLLVSLSEQDRRNYLSNLSMDEWEACGDVLLVHFSDMLTKMKDLRHARRRTAAIFEEEIKRRNDTVEKQSRDLSTKLDSMRSGGAEVLRGRAP